MNEHIDKRLETPLSQTGTHDEGLVRSLREQTGEKALGLRMKGKEMGAMFQHRPEWFLEFLRKTTQKKILIERVCSTILHRYPRLAEKFTRGDATVAILGGGTSEAELAILKRLSTTLKHLHYEDPSPEMESRFLANVFAHQLQCA